MVDKMNAGHFYWSKIDGGNGRIDGVFEQAKAEQLGFKVQIGMSEEDFIKQNSDLIQQKSLYDPEIASFELKDAMQKQQPNLKNLKNSGAVKKFVDLLSNLTKGTQTEKE